MSDTTKPERVCAELLPCPFCGEHAASAETRAAGHTFYGVDCQGCGAQVHESDEQRAALLWNTRPQPPAAPSTVNDHSPDAGNMASERYAHPPATPDAVTALREALEIIADGEGDAMVIAQQTLDQYLPKKGQIDD